MPRTSAEYQQLRDERREHVLQAALRVFARKGLSGTRMADIAKAAGVSYGLVYHYFTDKDELFTTIVEHALTGALQLVTVAHERPGAALDRIAWMVDTMLREGRENPEYFLIMIQVSIGESVPIGARHYFATLSPRINEHVVEMVREAQCAGQIVAGDPAKLTLALLSCVQGLMISAAMGTEGSESLPDGHVVLRMLKA